MSYDMIAKRNFPVAVRFAKPKSTNHFRAPKPLHTLFPSICPQNQVSRYKSVKPFRSKPLPILKIFCPQNRVSRSGQSGFQIGSIGFPDVKALSPLEPPNPSLYYFKVICSQNRVSSCKGVKPFRTPKPLPTLPPSNVSPKTGFQLLKAVLYEALRENGSKSLKSVT